MNTEHLTGSNNYFEDFHVSDVFDDARSKTMTEMDGVLITNGRLTIARTVKDVQDEDPAARDEVDEDVGRRGDGQLPNDSIERNWSGFGVLPHPLHGIPDAAGHAVSGCRIPGPEKASNLGEVLGRLLSPDQLQRAGRGASPSSRVPHVESHCSTASSSIRRPSMTSTRPAITPASRRSAARSESNSAGDTRTAAARPSRVSTTASPERSICSSSRGSSAWASFEWNDSAADTELRHADIPS